MKTIDDVVAAFNAYERSRERARSTEENNVYGRFSSEQIKRVRLQVETDRRTFDDVFRQYVAGLFGSGELDDRR